MQAHLKLLSGCGTYRAHVLLSSPDQGKSHAKPEVNRVEEYIPTRGKHEKGRDRKNNCRQIVLSTKTNLLIMNICFLPETQSYHSIKSSGLKTRISSFPSNPVTVLVYPKTYELEKTYCSPHHIPHTVVKQEQDNSNKYFCLEREGMGGTNPHHSEIPLSEYCGSPQPKGRNYSLIMPHFHFLGVLCQFIILHMSCLNFLGVLPSSIITLDHI